MKRIDVNNKNVTSNIKINTRTVCIIAWFVLMLIGVFMQLWWLFWVSFVMFFFDTHA